MVTETRRRSGFREPIVQGGSGPFDNGGVDRDPENDADV
jgi:hypothetical protein